MPGKGALKLALEQGLVWSHLPDVRRLTHRRGGLILAYHNVVPSGGAIGGDRSLHLPQAVFAAQLDSLQATHDVVPLDVLLEPGGAAGRRPRAVITFDDAYRGAVTVGLREVVARALPATVFVAPAFVGGRFFWWDVVTHAGASGPESIRQLALEECRGMDATVRQWAEEAGYQLSQLPPEAACASEDELRRAAKQPGVALASHTWSHPNLTRLRPSEVEQELTRPLAWLRERFDNVVPMLSYPYGLTSPTVERAAANAGYRAGLRVSGGWVGPQPRNPFALPRLNVPAGLSHNGFLLRTAGLL